MSDVNRFWLGVIAVFLSAVSLIVTVYVAGRRDGWEAAQQVYERRCSP